MLNLPNGPVRIKPDWLDRGASLIYLPGSMCWTKGQRWGGFTAYTGGPRKRPTPFGNGFGFGTTYGTGTTDRVTGPIFTTSVAYRSIVFASFANSTGGGNRGRIFQGNGQVGNGIQEESLFAMNISGSDMSYCRVGGTSGQGQWDWAGGGGSGTELNKWNIYGLSHNQTATGISPVLYKNGASVGINTTIASTGTYTSSSVAIDFGNRSTDGARGWDGIHGPLFMFDDPNSALTPDEHAMLSENMGDMFELEKRKLYFFATTAGTVTGDLIVTEAPDVFSAVDGTINGSLAVTEAQDTFASTGSVLVEGTLAATEAADTFAAISNFVLSFNYERANGNSALSYITGTGDSAVISIKGFPSENETTGNRVLQVGAQIDGVTGFRPTIELLDMLPFNTNNTHHGAILSSHRLAFSYDRETWTLFDTISIAPGGSNHVQARHNTNFTSSPVWVAENRQVNVTQVGQFYEDLANTYSFVQPTGYSFTPVNTTSYPAQSFIVDEYSPQTALDGRTSPYLPLYACVINDTSLGTHKAQAWLLSGVHSGEDIGNWAHARRVEFICSSDPEAILIRTHYKIYIMPMINPAGRYLGTFRSSPEQGPGGIDDANRHASDALPVGIEVVDLPRGVIAWIFANETGVKSWAMDDHGSTANPWEVYEDAGNPLQATFRSRLTTYSGLTFVDGGETPAGAFSKFFENQGFPLTATIEHGNLSGTAQTDASFVNAADGFAQAINYMREQGDIPGAEALEATEAPDTFAASGDLSLAGTFAATEARDTFAGNGGVIISGTFAATEARDVVSIFGFVATGGTLAATEAKDTFYAIGGIAIPGSPFETHGVLGQIDTYNIVLGTIDPEGVTVRG